MKVGPAAFERPGVGLPPLASQAPLELGRPVVVVDHDEDLAGRGGPKPRPHGDLVPEAGVEPALGVNRTGS